MQATRILCDDEQTCSRCTKDSGLFKECVIDSDPSGNVMRDCSSCRYQNYGLDCTYKCLLLLLLLLFSSSSRPTNPVKGSLDVQRKNIGNEGESEVGSDQISDENEKQWDKWRKGSEEEKIIKEKERIKDFFFTLQFDSSAHFSLQSFHNSNFFTETVKTSFWSLHISTIFVFSTGKFDHVKLKPS